jgi:hypothetical protein
MDDPCDCRRGDADEYVAPPRDRREWRRQAPGRVQKDEDDAEYANRLHANEQRQWHAVKGFAQCLGASDDQAKDHNREHHSGAQTEGAESTLGIQDSRRRQNDHEHEPRVEARCEANSSGRVFAERAGQSRDHDRGRRSECDGTDEIEIYRLFLQVGCQLTCLVARYSSRADRILRRDFRLRRRFDENVHLLADVDREAVGFEAVDDLQDARVSTRSSLAPVRERFGTT